MLKLFNSLWRSATRQATKVQRKQTRKLIRQIIKPAASQVVRKPTIKKVRVPSGTWNRNRFMSLNSDPSLGLLAGTRMDYWLYQPGTLSAGDTPLVVMLHGCSQNAIDFAAGTRMNLLGESKGFGVLYPQQSARMNSQRCWHWYKKPVQHGKGEAALIAELIQQVVTRYGFDPARVYLAGISAGAGMAHIIALNHPDLIAAVGLHSAPRFGVAHDAVSAFAVMQHGGGVAHGGSGDPGHSTESAPAPLMPAILIQGLQDTVVRPINVTQLESQFCQRNRLTAAQRQATVHRPAGKSARSAHAFDTSDYRLGRQTVLRVCRIDNLSHAWSGGDAAYRFNERRGPDASRLMWTFFARHRRELAAP
jgi:poly(hydroxyalkanoate) depolymerase family esterase